MLYLHSYSPPICHADLKSSNVLYENPRLPAYLHTFNYWCISKLYINQCLAWCQWIGWIEECEQRSQIFRSRWTGMSHIIASDSHIIASVFGCHLDTRTVSFMMCGTDIAMVVGRCWGQLSNSWVGVMLDPANTLKASFQLSFMCYIVCAKLWLALYHENYLQDTTVVASQCSTVDGAWNLEWRGTYN